MHRIGEVGLIGRKLGMSRIFKDGSSIPVTYIEVLPHYVTDIRSYNDSFGAIQVTTGSKKQSKVSKAESGHFKRAEVKPGRGLWEFRLPTGALEQYKLGQSFSISDVFEIDNKVDVSGISKGKGFAGVVKRWNFSTQDATHGNSLSHSAPGSIGQNQTPGRVFKGKKMCGHLGNENVTVQNLDVVEIDLERNLIKVRGGIPGAPGSDVILVPAKKRKVEEVV